MKRRDALKALAAIPGLPAIASSIEVIDKEPDALMLVLETADAGDMPIAAIRDLGESVYEQIGIPLLVVPKGAKVYLIRKSDADEICVQSEVSE